MRRSDMERDCTGVFGKKGSVMIIEMDNKFRGNAYIIKSDEVLLNYSGGYADMANEIPNTLNTRFATASMGKTFVAVGILQLIEAGKLKFDDTLGTILDIDLKSIDPGVTVKQLLNHTSGVPDYFDESVMDDYEALWTDYPNYRIRHNEDMLPLFIDKPMMYPKGEKFQYNNTGYILLAMIIEKITGLDFDIYLKRNVFDACGMDSTGYFAFDKHHIEVKVDMDELDLTSAEAKATYKEIQEWVQEKYGFHVTNLNIAQVKQKHGIIERENYNKPKSSYSKQPGCPEEKVKAIEDAMQHFQMI